MAKAIAKSSDLKERPYSPVNVPQATYIKLRTFAKFRGMLIQKVLEFAVEEYLKAREE